MFQQVQMIPRFEIWLLLLWTRADASRIRGGFFPPQGSVAAYTSLQGHQRPPIYQDQAYSAVRHTSKFGSDYNDEQFLNPNGAHPRPYPQPISSNPYPNPVQQGYTGSQSQRQGYPETNEFGSDYQSDTANRMIVVSKSFGKGKNARSSPHQSSPARTRTGTLQVIVDQKQFFCFY